MTHARVVSGDFEMMVDYGPRESYGTVDPLNHEWQFAVRYVWRGRMTSDYIAFVVTELDMGVIREMFPRIAQNPQARRFFDNVLSEMRRMEVERRPRNPWRSVSPSSLMPSSWRV